MKKRKKQKYGLLLMLIVIFCLSACVREYCECISPVYPVAGKKVAEELEKAGELPYTWEWIGRIDKLRQELE